MPERELTQRPRGCRSRSRGRLFSKTEHRGTLRFGVGWFGIGGRVTWSREITHHDLFPDARTSSLSLSAIVELRLPSAN